MRGQDKTEFAFTYQTTPFSARADLLPKLDWKKIPTDLNSIIESMTWEDLEISEYRDLLTMLDAIGMSERKEEKGLLKKIEEQIYYEIDNQISNVTEAEDLSGLVDEIIDLVPYELFKCDFLSDLEDKKKSFEELEKDYDEDAYREFRSGSTKEDDAAIEEMMTSLREL